MPTALVKHVPALDGIRGLAIILVLIYHLLQANRETTSTSLKWVMAVADSCWVGVDLFFVLSGFLITGILYDSINDAGYFRKFYVRRSLRIFPLYYGVLFVLLALTGPLHLVWHGMQWVLLLYLQNTGLGAPLFSIRPSPFVDLTHLWSLAVEEQFYLVWPFLLFWIKDIKRLIVATTLLSVAALLLRAGLFFHGMDPRFLYCFTACRADTLLLGATLALLLRSEWRERTLASANWVFGLSLVVIVGFAIWNVGLNWSLGWFLPTAGFTLLALCGAGLIATTLAARSWTQPLFESAGLRFFGKYSYGIYVFHIPIASLIDLRVRRWIFSVTDSKLIAVVATALAMTLLTILVAYASFHLYEKHFLRLKSRFEYSRQHRQAMRADVVDGTPDPSLASTGLLRPSGLSPAGSQKTRPAVVVDGPGI